MRDKEPGQQDILEALIRRAGPRRQPAHELELRVRDAAYDAWQRALSADRRRTVSQWLAAAAIVGIAVLVAWRAVPDRTAETVATIASAARDLKLNSLSVDLSSQALALHAGDTLRTGGGTRIDVRSGIHLRLAPGSEIKWIGLESIELLAGSLYVDSGASTAKLRISTPFGAISHLGTRYQIRTDGDSLRVGVREGLVTIERARDRLEARAGEEFVLDRSDAAKRRSLEPFGRDWQWADSLAPRFDIEGRTLKDFLAWAALETGRSIEYRDPVIEREASITVLHGSSLELNPEDAIGAVLPTTDFVALTSGARIVVSRR